MTTNNAITLAAAPVADEIVATALRRSRPSWYIITNKGDNEAEIRIYEDIGLFGVTAKQFADDLEQISAEIIHVRLNTYGGEAFDGIAIQNALQAHEAKIIVHVDGIAASAGSIIAMAGDEIRMANNAFLMIHEANGGVFGEAGDMRNYADMLDKLNDSIASTYQQRAGKTRKYWRDKMAEETWFAASEAKAEGLADSIDEPVKSAKNRFDFKIYNRAPEDARKQWGIPNQQPAPEPSSRDEAPPVLTKEKPIMADTTNPAPAPGPVAAEPVSSPKPIDAAENRHAELVKLNQQAIEGYLAQGKNTGVIEGRKLEMDRAGAIAAVCPGKPEMAIAAILGGQSPESAKLAYEAALAAEAKAKEISDAKDAEIARWQALAATGGYPGGVPVSVSGTIESELDTGPLTVEEAKIQATNEWDHKPTVRKGFSSKQNYVNARAMELTGRFQLVKSA